MEDELAVLNGEVSSLKKALTIKQDFVNLANGTVASLEIKNAELEKDNVKMKKIVTKLMAGKPKSDDSKAKKDLKEANTKLEDAMRTIRDETNKRAEVEAQLVMAVKLNDVLKEIMSRQGQQVPTQEIRRQDTRSQGSRSQGSRRQGSRSPSRSPSRRDSRSTQLCRDVSKPGGCRWKDKCHFFHPPGRSNSSSQPSREEKTDCNYWKAGYCKKTEDECRGKHESSKFGSKPSTKSAASKTSDLSNPDFVNTLVKAVSEGLAGVQKAAQYPALRQNGVEPQQQHMMMVPQGSHPPARGQHGVVIQPQHQQMMQAPMMMMPATSNMFFPSLGGQGQQQ